ncbi:unnamed protein product [Calicophoron daubneyi]|uniref:E3 UFM1-protein ligase 1 homolog n=1 Tax=Calicophoron daubneyi TaxID=300641 RepID=A0AAV2T1U2_CALDB
MATWTEVHELAAQLKKTQEKSSSRSLSERTWVDIVRHLINAQRLKLVFTTDGRSYLTKEELEKEIREEVEAHSGRVSLAEIASNLDIDPLIIETRIADMLSTDATDSTGRLIAIPGELIDESYIRQVAHEIQDILEERGQISIGELATNFGLPTSFLHNIIDDYHGVLFKVHKYGEKYITDDFFAENRAKVRGHFTALLHPVTLSSAAGKIHVPDSLLSSIVTSLISSGQLNGTLIAGRGTYVPSCYSYAEDAYVCSFFTQNGYIEWNYLKRSGIADPSAYVRSLLPDATHLTGLSVGPAILDQLKTLVEEAARERSWADLTHCLPVSLSAKERLLVIEPYVKDLPLKSVDGGCFVISDEFVTKCETYFTKLILQKAELAARKERTVVSSVQDGPNLTSDQSSKRPQTNKGGFGVGAREIKMKNVKKKYNPSKKGRDEVDELETSSVSSGAVFSRYLSVDELRDVLLSELPIDTPDEVVNGVLTLLLPALERTFSRTLSSIFLPNSDIGFKRDALMKDQEAVNNMLFNMQLMERGVGLITDMVLRAKLLRHLIKNQGACVIDRLCAHLAKSYEITWPALDVAMKANEEALTISEPSDTKENLEFVSPVSSEQRLRLVDLLKQCTSTEALATANALQQLLSKVRSLQMGEPSVTEFYDLIESFASERLGFYFSALRARADNKRKRDERAKANELAFQVESQLQSSLDAVRTSPDAKNVATATLAAACLFAQIAVGWPVVAPGRCVPSLVSWLCKFVDTKKIEASETKAKLPCVLEILISSGVCEQLAALTDRVTEQMRIGESNIITEGSIDIVEVVSHLLEVGKKCRRLLYA